MLLLETNLPQGSNGMTQTSWRVVCYSLNGQSCIIQRVVKKQSSYNAE